LTKFIGTIVTLCAAQSLAVETEVVVRRLEDKK